MAMHLSHGRGAAVRPVMNVTPLVDVVLVVLIIFMIITPLLEKKLSVSLPPKEERELPSEGTSTPIVLTVDAKGEYALNSERVSEAELPERVRRALAARAEPVLFFDAADDAPVGAAVAALDLARSGGAVTIAALPEKLSP